jgi:uncharacterized protein YggE
MIWPPSFVRGPRGAAVTAVLLAAACAHGPARDGSADPVLRVAGEGRVAARPDLATVALGVEALAKALPDALRDADARSRAIVAALAGAGVAEKDVRTTRYDVQLERRYDPQRGGPGELIGYRVVHELRVAIRGGDPGRVGAALEAATRSGANVVHSISFEKEDVTAERARALELAIAAARAKAEAMARAAGRPLGDVRAVSEGGGRGPIVPLRKTTMMASAAEAGAPVQAGELEVAADVEVEFGLR